MYESEGRGRDHRGRDTGPTPVKKLVTGLNDTRENGLRFVNTYVLLFFHNRAKSLPFR